MSNFSFLVILLAEYLFGALMLDIISSEGIKHSAIFCGVSMLLVWLVCMIYGKISKSQKIRICQLFKKVMPTALGMELILLFFLRMYILSQI